MIIGFPVFIIHAQAKHNLCKKEERRWMIIQSTFYPYLCRNEIRKTWFQLNIFVAVHNKSKVTDLDMTARSQLNFFLVVLAWRELEEELPNQDGHELDIHMKYATINGFNSSPEMDIVQETKFYRHQIWFKSEEPFLPFVDRQYYSKKKLLNHFDVW